MSPSLFTLAANYSALRVVYEIDQPLNLGEFAVFFERLGDRFVAQSFEKKACGLPT